MAQAALGNKASQPVSSAFWMVINVT